MWVRRVPLRCGVLLFHDSNLSKVWSLQETQAGSADGSKRRTVEVIADRFQAISARRGDEKAG
jgi:hypothetical protein